VVAVSTVLNIYIHTHTHTHIYIYIYIYIYNELNAILYVHTALIFPLTKLQVIFSPRPQVEFGKENYIGRDGLYNHLLKNYNDVTVIGKQNIA